MIRVLDISGKVYPYPLAETMSLNGEWMILLTRPVLEGQPARTVAVFSSRNIVGVETELASNRLAPVLDFPDGGSATERDKAPN